MDLPLEDARTRLRRRAHEAVDRYVPRWAQRFVRWLRSDEFFSTSASLAFYAMVSLPPMALVALWVAGAFVSDTALEDLGSRVGEETPEQLPVAPILSELIRLAQTVGAVSVLTALWPATAYGAALTRAFHRVTPNAERRAQGLRGRALALVVIALLPVSVFAALAGLFAVPRLLPGSGAWVTAALALGAYAGLVLVVATVYGLYRVRDTAWRDVGLGAVTAATLMAVASGGYLLYLEWFADFEGNYGATSLATAVLLGLWLMLNNAMLLVGYRIMLRRATARARSRGRDPDGERSEPRESVGGR